MIDIPSKIEGMKFDLFKLEQKLKPIGFSIGGNWDYDHGCFDYKLNDQEGYQFLRLPFTAVEGELDVRDCTVELGRPFLLSHVYEPGIDEEGKTGAISGSFNQFQEPIDKDGNFPSHEVDRGKSLVERIETILLT
ncbi:hypothetical protein HPT25_02560 [Bacillus sp. BRMEA1]|uniref:YugN-like family protein n=1 Tax=Neobacillus endophyticus TaxID=2738405 RepID=UPI001565B1DA|nr:YugN-like family protein [Neobacillus endophyticus]NRD76369.1 hypothetical protein [Neobacillus endophyticus]